jgi:hypothetical protein
VIMELMNRKEVRKPKSMRCCCGEILTQGSGYFATDYACGKCGTEYNSSGHKLAPRCQWGEETGEYFE